MKRQNFLRQMITIASLPILLTGCAGETKTPAPPPAEQSTPQTEIQVQETPQPSQPPVQAKAPSTTTTP